MIAVVGWIIFVGSLASEFQLESKVYANAKYAHPSIKRHNLIAVHGRGFYVGEHDFWRSQVTVYLMFVGGLVIWAGWRMQGRKV